MKVTRRTLPRGACRVQALVTSFFVVAATAFFCWSWGERAEQIPAGASAGEPRAEQGLRPPDGPASESFLARSLRIIAPTIVSPSPRRSNPFEELRTREMLAARTDPFLSAYSTGQTEGELVVRGRSRGITTLGFPSSRSSKNRETLRAIDSSLGGSFSQFFARVLLHSGDETALGLYTIAVPIRNAASGVLAALTMCVPTARMNPPRREPQFRPRHDCSHRRLRAVCPSPFRRGLDPQKGTELQQLRHDHKETLAGARAIRTVDRVRMSVVELGLLVRRRG